MQKWIFVQLAPVSPTLKERGVCNTPQNFLAFCAKIWTEMLIFLWKLI